MLSFRKRNVLLLLAAAVLFYLFTFRRFDADLRHQKHDDTVNRTSDTERYGTNGSAGYASSSNDVLDESREVVAEVGDKEDKVGKDLPEKETKTKTKSTTKKKKKLPAKGWIPPHDGFTPLPPVAGWRDVWNTDRPEGAVGPVDLPPFLGSDRGSTDHVRRDVVKDMMLHAWTTYKTHAWGYDELKPMTQKGHNWYGNFSLLNTPVDALDTLFIMNLTEQYKEAKELVLANLTLSGLTRPLNIFETHIRITGGLLSAYELDSDPRLLEKCIEFVEQMMPSFNTPNGFTMNSLVPNLASRPNHTVMGSVLLAELGTLQLEFQYLSDITGDPKYAKMALLAFEQLNVRNISHPGLYPVSQDTYTFKAPPYAEYSLGGRSDSFYEYLLKLWLSTGEERYRRMYLVASHALADYVVTDSATSAVNADDKLEKNTYCPAVHVASHVKLPPQDASTIYRGYYFEHLSCFAGGMFALGALATRRGDWTKHLDVGRRITDTCFRSYNATSTGLGPESVNGNNLSGVNRMYILRPETVESLFYMWRFTHDPIYREQGWFIVQALNENCRSPSGFHGLRDVTMKNPTSPDDLQQSFFLAETLKYLYLLFSDDDLIPLEKYVFNTEAHPIGIRGHGKRADPDTWSRLPLQPQDFKFRQIGKVHDPDGTIERSLHPPTASAKSYPTGRYSGNSFNAGRNRTGPAASAAAAASAATKNDDVKYVNATSSATRDDGEAAGAEALVVEGDNSEAAGAEALVVEGDNSEAAGAEALVVEGDNGDEDVWVVADEVGNDTVVPIVDAGVVAGNVALSAKAEGVEAAVPTAVVKRKKKGPALATRKEKPVKVSDTSDAPVANDVYPGVDSKKKVPSENAPVLPTTTGSSPATISDVDEVIPKANRRVKNVDDDAALEDETPAAALKPTVKRGGKNAPDVAALDDETPTATPKPSVKKGAKNAPDVAALDDETPTAIPKPSVKKGAKNAPDAVPLDNETPAAAAPKPDAVPLDNETPAAVPKLTVKKDAKNATDAVVVDEGTPAAAPVRHAMHVDKEGDDSAVGFQAVD